MSTQPCIWPDLYRPFREEVPCRAIAKHAMVELTQALSTRCRRTGVLVACLCPSQAAWTLQTTTEAFLRLVTTGKNGGHHVCLEAWAAIHLQGPWCPHGLPFCLRWHLVVPAVWGGGGSETSSLPHCPRPPGHPPGPPFGRHHGHPPGRPPVPPHNCCCGHLFSVQ